MAIDMFETREMLDKFEQIPPKKTYLRDTFFSNVVTFRTEKVDIDIVKGGRRMAPFVSPMLPGKIVDHAGYRTSTIEVPLVKPKMVTHAHELQHRMPGEAIYGDRTPADRANERLTLDMVELDDLITRREEWMCAQALFTGGITITGDGVSASVSYDIDAKTLGVSAKWSASGSDPIADLKGYHRAIVKRCGLGPTVCIMASNVVDVFAKHATVLTTLDNLRVNRGQIDPEYYNDLGLTYYGYIKELGLNIFSYDAWYLDDDGVDQPMVPANKLLLANPSARTMLAYGAITEVTENGQFVTYEEARVPTSWVEKDPARRYLMLQSRPLPVPIMADAFQILTVL